MSTSIFNNNNNSSISISVSDGEPDELGPLRIRVRRKRKKHHQPRNHELTHRFLRFLLKHWMLLVIFAAIALLLFEASRISLKPQLTNNLQQGIKTTPHFKNNSKTSPEPKNLNRVDPPRCLKLLSNEELQNLDIPSLDGLNNAVKNVVYVSEKGNGQGGNGISGLSQLRSEGIRFNLFTGDQTFDQREKSFKVSDTMEVHCGFYSDNGGFKISDEDKRYMGTCKAVVSTCAFGGGDDLYQPIGMTDTSLQKVCYVAFWDEITLAVQESKGRRVGEDNFIGKWWIVVMRDLPFTDQRLNGKIPKMLGHRLFPNAKYSIWVDSKSQFRRDPLGVLESLLWRSNSALAISLHGARSSVYEEAVAVVKKHKAGPEEVELQLSQYRRDGLPEDKRFNGKKALNEASVIVRDHSPVTNLFMCLWFNEVVRFTSRDQLSFPYVLWRLKVLKDINMFPVCIRKDLVNSKGHIGKAKPLVVGQF